MKIIKFALLYFFAVLFSRSLYSQTFTPLANGTNDAVRVLCADTINNLIYAGGNFNNAGTVAANHVAVWDGTTWDSLSSGSWENVLGLQMFQGNLIAGGPFISIGNAGGAGIGLWSNNQWQFIANIYEIQGVYGGVVDLQVVNNELYALGIFDSISGQHFSKIAKWNGTTWSGFPVLDNDLTGFAITQAVNYNGELYVGGNFDSQLATNMKDIAKWNGTTWVPVGNGLSGPFSWVTKMLVYKNELYVSGYFSQASGDPENYIMKWNGSAWSPLASGTDGQVDNMIIFQNDLIVGGTFTTAGGIPVNSIAKWNGTQWSAIPNANFNNGIDAFAVLNNELYIGGGFTAVNNLPVNKIVKYSSSVGFTTLENKKEILITPNHAHQNITIRLPDTNKALVQIINTMGALIYEKDFINFKDETVTINTAAYAKGMYVVKVNVVGMVGESLKLVVE